MMPTLPNMTNVGQSKSAKAPVPKRIYFVPYQTARWLHRLHGRCAVCGLARHQGVICQACQSVIPQRVPARQLTLDTAMTTTRTVRLYPVSYYQYPVNRLITRLKDHEDVVALMALGELLRTMPKPSVCHADNTVIIPVPTTASRIRQRGFDPVLLLAKHLAHQWQLPIWQGLIRHGGKVHQRGLDKQARMANIQGDFEMIGRVQATYAIIFDDVATTGTTMQAIAKAVLAKQPTLKLMAICMAHGSPMMGLPVV